jgi:DNA-binding transcriptional ArsR family regulator
MANYTDDQLDKLFRGLSNQTRRDLLERLSRSTGPMQVGELAAHYKMSLPAISKHLDYLERSGLVRSVKIGRAVWVVVVRQAYQELEWWLAEQLHFWKQQEGDALRQLAEKARQK